MMIMRIVMIDMLPSLFDFLSAGVYPDNGISNPTVRRRRREEPR
jgi:hypothetical protein